MLSIFLFLVAISLYHFMKNTTVLVFLIVDFLLFLVQGGDGSLCLSLGSASPTLGINRCVLKHLFMREETKPKR